MIAYIAALVAIFGLLLYVMSGNPKVCEIGRILFFCGAFVTVQAVAGRTVKLF